MRKFGNLKLSGEVLDSFFILEERRMERMADDILKIIGINSKGYGTFPKLVAQDQRLTIEAKAIYAYFCSYAGTGDTAFPSVAKILYDLCISKTRYYKHFKCLTDCGYIIVEQIKEKTQFSHNIYTITNQIPDDKQAGKSRVLVLRTRKKPCPRFGDTRNGDTQNRDTNTNTLNINNYKNNNINRQKKNKTEKGKTEPGKYDKFYL